MGLTQYTQNQTPFLLPKGNVQIAFSGGRTSGFMLHKILEANGGLPDRAKVIFTNTGREMNETLDFVQEVGATWSVPIIWLEYTRPEGKVSFAQVSHNSASRNGEPFKTLIHFKKYLPNAVERFCTGQLKVLTAKRFLVASGWKSWTNTLGIRADEKRRIKVAPENERWVNWYPLNEGGVTKSDVHSFWKRHPFDLRLQSVNDTTPDGNCDCCFLKSEAAIAAMMRDHPDRAQWWPDMEASVDGTFHKTRSYADLLAFVQKQGDWIFDNKEYLCQVDGGECSQ